VDAEKNLLYLRGAVPGARRSIVKIMRSTFGKPSGKPSGK
jgi:ribosomal protein L3